MPGPLPDPQSRRRNAPTVAPNTLPVTGRQGPVPECPLELGEHGAKWWTWAWGLPQAVRWDPGTLYFVARRALLEDHAAALRFSDELDVQSMFSAGDQEAARNVEWALGLLKRSATGEVALMKEMRELDNRLGLNPKALADLRWVVGEAEAEAETPTVAAGAQVRRLRAVDATAAG